MSSEKAPSTAQGHTANQENPWWEPLSPPDEWEARAYFDNLANENEIRDEFLRNRDNKDRYWFCNATCKGSYLCDDRLEILHLNDATELDQDGCYAHAHAYQTYRIQTQNHKIMLRAEEGDDEYGDKSWGLITNISDFPHRLCLLYHLHKHLGMRIEGLKPEDAKNEIEKYKAKGEDIFSDSAGMDRLVAQAYNWIISGSYCRDERRPPAIPVRFCSTEDSIVFKDRSILLRRNWADGEKEFMEAEQQQSCRHWPNPDFTVDGR